MKNIKIIIGASGGDEGKGLATDYFASQHDHGIVVMGNGGAQRGHTVELPDGTRHVFQHFGSGTLRGWDTYFSSDFILNPMQFCREYDELKKITNKKFEIYCDPNCRWSTPWDMLFNQISQRLVFSPMKHNTCGMGIWSTICRYKYCEYNNIETYSLCQFFGLKPQERLDYLRKIKEYYKKMLIMRMQMRDDKVSDLISLIDNKELMNHFYIDMMRMNQIIGLDYTMPLYLYDNIIIENGQGLLIDSQTDISFGTPTRTGIEIPLKILDRFPRCERDVEAVYVTRSYTTRHGVGVLKDEVNSGQINNWMFDETNQFNEFQGGLRYGLLYPHALLRRIDDDFSKANPGIKKSLMVTHLNEKSFDISSIKDFFNRVYVSDTKYARDVTVYKDEE